MTTRSKYSMDNLKYEKSKSIECCSCRFPLPVVDDYKWSKNYLDRFCGHCGLQFTLRALDKFYGLDAFVSISELPGFNEYYYQVTKTKPKRVENKMKIQKEMDYVNVETAKRNAKFTILNEGEYVPDKSAYAQGADAQKLVFHVKTNGEEMLYTPNKTSRKYLIEKYGDDTANWINKPLEWEIVMKADPENKGEVKEQLFIKGSTNKK